MQVNRALVSVSDKTGLVDFALKLESTGVVIISTGGTARALRDAGLSPIKVSDFTGFPEIMDGRVKTLHPKVHGGILCIRDNENHRAEAEANGIGFIDLVVVNLYTFRETVAKPGMSFADAVEQIDIGGPAMIRSAAKNWEHVAVVVHPADYDLVIGEILHQNRSISRRTRFHLALKAFGHTRDYDRAIEAYFASKVGEIR